MGECVNVHAYDASIVLGYCFLIENRLALQMNRDARRPWGDLFGRSLASLSGRRSPLDSHELFEAAVLFAVDFSQRPFRVRFDTETLEWDEFCETLLDHVKDRNPTLRNRIETRD